MPPFAVTIAFAAALAAPFHPKSIFSLGDSITAGVNLPDPATQAYPYLLAAHYGASVSDLAVGGAAAGTQRPGDVIRDQLGQVHAPCDLATLNIGTNDVTRIAEGQYTLADYKKNVAQIVATLRSACGRVVVTTVLDNPWNVLATGRDAAIWATDVAQENAFLRTMAGVTLVDINADARLHQQSSFADQGFLHPSVAGHQFIAEDIESAL